MARFGQSFINSLINPSYADQMTQVGMLGGSFMGRRRLEEEEKAKKLKEAQIASMMATGEGATERAALMRNRAQGVLSGQVASAPPELAAIAQAGAMKAGVKPTDVNAAAQLGEKRQQAQKAEELKKGVSAALNLRNAVNNATTPDQRDAANNALEKVLASYPEVRESYNKITQGEQTAAIQQESNLRAGNAETRAQELHESAVRKAEADANKAVRVAEGKGENPSWLENVPASAWNTDEGLEAIALTALQNGDSTMFQRVSDLREQGKAARMGVNMETVSKSLKAANPGFEKSQEDRRNAEILLSQADLAASGPAGLKVLQDRFIADFAPATASRALAEMVALRGATDITNRFGNMFATLFDGRSTLQTQEEYREIAKFMRDFANYEISKTIDAVEAGGGTENMGVAETARRVYGVLEDNMFTEDPADAERREMAKAALDRQQAEATLGRPL